MDIQGILFSIILKDSYLIAPLAHADKQPNPNLPCSTRLDGDQIQYNPELLDKMKDDGPSQILGEIIHMSLMHPERRKSVTTGMSEMEPIFDVAADLATFHNITSSTKFIRPGDFEFPEGLAAEEYFNLLCDLVQQKGVNMSEIMGGQSSSGQGEQGDDQSGQVEGKDQGSGSSQKQDGGERTANAYNKLLRALGAKGKHKQDHSQWGEVPISAQHTQKMILMDVLKHRGDIPLGLKRLLHLLQGEPQIRWTDRLRNLVGSFIAATRKKYTMMRPSRRFGIPHPGTKRLKRGMIAVHIDTSGSMDDMDTAIAIKEVKGIADAYGAPFTLMMGDTEVQVVEKVLSKYDLDKIQIKGGGGTDHRPLFKYVEDHKMAIELLICITDLWTVLPERPPRYKVLWVTCTDEKPHFGEVMKIEKKGN